MSRRFWFTCILCMGLAGLNIHTFEIYRFLGQFRVLFIDVGQGDASLLVYGNRSILVDGGNREGPNLCRTRLKTTLDQLGISRIDILVLTHPHADHVSGLAWILEEYPVGFCLQSVGDHDSQIYQHFKTLLHQTRTPVLVPKPGTRVRLGESLELDFLSPDGGIGGGISSLNDLSLVFLAQLGKRSVLFTGDIEARMEKLLVERYGSALKADILKVPHHGSKTSNSAPFLDRVQPKIAIISCGEGNAYGFPSDRVMRGLRGYTQQIYQTMKEGTIQAMVKDDAWVIQTFGRP